MSRTVRENKPVNLIDRITRRGFFSRLEKLQHGQIIIQETGTKSQFGEITNQCPLSVTITVKDPQFYSDIAFSGSVGAGESYFQEKWDCSDLTALVRILLQNREVLDGMDSHIGLIKEPLNKMFHWLNRNTRRGSRRNIEAHYDLGNDLFSLFLDKNMMYSSAVYELPEYTLEQAAIAKLDRICVKMDLNPSDHVLEIGTGWGGFAIFAAQNYGCRVTTTTISGEQYNLAKQRVEQAGLDDKVTVLYQDYRNLDGQYDKLVSIEMIEAIGHQYLPVYFEQCSHLLKPEGMMLLQAITIADQRYKSALRSVDFIQRYIFPGSFIPSVSSMVDAIAKNTDMRLFNLEDIGPHYATTLRHWRERFFERIDEVRSQGYSEAFIRMWEFYLCYCEGGFLERAIGDVQMLLVKPQCRRDAITTPLD
jgi:cyclopropane-fatty-acyl-phospholipid synthase